MQYMLCVFDAKTCIVKCHNHLLVKHAWKTGYMGTTKTNCKGTSERALHPHRTQVLLASEAMQDLTLTGISFFLDTIVSEYLIIYVLFHYNMACYNVHYLKFGGAFCKWSQKKNTFNMYKENPEMRDRRSIEILLSKFIL